MLFAGTPKFSFRGCEPRARELWMGICASNIGEAILHHECWAEAACIDRSKRSLDDLTGRITVLSCVGLLPSLDV